VAVFVLGLLKGMSTSSSGSNAGHSGASFVGLRLAFFNSFSESLHVEVEMEVREDPASEHAESLCREEMGMSGRLRVFEIIF